MLLTSYICIYSCDYILLYQELHFQHSAISLVRQQEDKHPKTRQKKLHYHESALRHRRRCHRRHRRRCLRHRLLLPLDARPPLSSFLLLPVFSLVLVLVSVLVLVLVLLERMVVANSDNLHSSKLCL